MSKFNRELSAKVAKATQLNEQIRLALRAEPRDTARIDALIEERNAIRRSYP